MSILVNENTRVVVQGITGREGSFHARQMIEYGTKVVAGMTPGKGGTSFEGVPIFNTMEQAIKETGANVAIIFIPAAVAPDAVMEAADAGTPLVICITEGIPILDMVRVRRYLSGRSTRLIGPNCPGIISPGKSKVGIMPGPIHLPGKIGVVSRSGTLTYEIVDQLTSRGIGQSSCVGIGGDPIIGSSFVDILGLFEADPETEAVIMVGEIGGTAEEEAAEFIHRNMSKPVVAFVAGRTAPPGRRMGHAGAIISGGHGTAAEKIAALESCGITVVPNPAEIGATMERVLAKR